MTPKQTIQTHLISAIIKRTVRECKLRGLDATTTNRCLNVAIHEIERGSSSDKALYNAMSRASRLEFAV